MDLVLRLKGEEIARVKLLPPSQFTKELESLRKQYKDQITKEGVTPEFCIENVPSSLNHFKPLA